jgi:hypothetical protein
MVAISVNPWRRFYGAAGNTAQKSAGRFAYPLGSIDNFNFSFALRAGIIRAN